MTPLERRLEASLKQRATDAEPTPALWAQVDRRLTRRRWSVRVAWVTAGVAAAVVALVVPGLLGGPTLPVPDIAGEVDDLRDGTPADEDGAEDRTEAPDVDDPNAGVDPDPDDPVTGPRSPEEAGLGRLGQPMLVAAGPELRLLDDTGQTSRRITLPAEGESSIVGLAVRPGSTAEDLAAVVLTLAEGMWDLRGLRVLDDETTWTQVDEPHRPAVESAGDGQVDGPIWSPDGSSLAWLERDPTGTTLRTIGWEDGPGTGRSADDNAAFVLDVDGLDLRVVSWDAVDESRSLLRMVSATPEGAYYELPIERQADGALAVGRTSPIRQNPDPGILGDGQVLVVTGGGPGQDPDGEWWRWLVGRDAEGVLVWPQVSADGVGEPVALGAELPAADAGSALSASASDWGLVLADVGAARGVLVLPDGEVEPIPGDVSFVHPLAVEVG